MKIRYLTAVLIIICLVLSGRTIAQETNSVNGYIRDKENGEWLIGAAVEVVELGIGTASNEYGFFSMGLPVGKSLTLQFS